MFDDYSLPEGNLVADIGGADGAMISELLARNPDRRGMERIIPSPSPFSSIKATLQ